MKRSMVTIWVLCGLIFLSYQLTAAPPAAKPDLQVAMIKIWQGYHLKAYIKNIGNVGLPAFLYNVSTVRHQGYWLELVVNNILATNMPLKRFDPQKKLMNPGSNINVVLIPSKVPHFRNRKLKLGANNVTVKITPYNAGGIENNYGNNTLSKKVFVRMRDLIISDIKLVTRNPRKNQLIYFLVTTKNIGNLMSVVSHTRLQVGRIHVKTISVPGLRPNQSFTKKIRTNYFKFAQRYRLTAVADYSKVVVEYNENNNKKYLDFTVRN